MDDYDYDSPASPASYNSAGTRSGKPKRLNHNELERKRRHHQKERLTELKDAIPTLQVEKPSTVLIMQKAKEYIDVLKKRCDEMENEMDRMRHALMQLTAQNQNQRAMMQQPSGYRGGQEGTETDALRRENMELKNQLLLLDKKFTGFPKPLEANNSKPEWSQQPAVKSMDNVGVDNLNGINMWPMPGPMANRSHHNQRDGHTQAHVHATTALPSQPLNLAHRPPNPIPAADRLVGGMNPPPSSMVLGPNGSAPNRMNVAQGDSPSVHLQSTNQVSGDLNAPAYNNTSMDMSSHLRKRMSLVDHEYNDMQQGFYGRRNSTIEALEAMRETQSYNMHPSNSTPTARQDATAIHSMGEETYAGEEVKCRVCNGGLAGLIMLDCDRCHNWYHGRCVGVDSKKIPSSWICNPCLGV